MEDNELFDKARANPIVKRFNNDTNEYENVNNTETNKPYFMEEVLYNYKKQFKESLGKQL